VDIKVGAVSPPSRAAAKEAGQGERVLEAKVLAVRPPRQRPGRPPHRTGERREGSARRDPAGGRILVLLIPEGHKVPQGLASGSHRVFIRFARR
jgi:hypothetical protein